MRAHFRAALPTDLGSGSTAARDPQRTAQGWSRSPTRTARRALPRRSKRGADRQIRYGTAHGVAARRSSLDFEAESRIAVGADRLREWFKADPHHG